VAWWFAIVLGVLQGLTEFLPVSSTAHLRIAPALLGERDPGAAYTAVLQLGTLAAVLGFYRRKVFVDLPLGVLRDPRGPNGRLALYLIVATLPVAVGGVLLKDFIVGDARSLWVVSGALISVGILMVFISARARHARDLAELTLVDAGIIGLAQACALVPGVSRSGATILCALALGLRGSAAAEFSFLLSIPAIAGAGIFEMDEAIDAFGGDPAPLVIGTAVAGVTGYAAIAWFIRFVGQRGLNGFALYRILLGAMLIVLLVTHVLSPFAGV
jgi:undecaprenyl-diphosphatase